MATPGLVVYLYTVLGTWNFVGTQLLSFLKSSKRSSKRKIFTDGLFKQNHGHQNKNYHFFQGYGGFPQFWEHMNTVFTTFEGCKCVVLSIHSRKKNGDETNL